MKIINQAQSEQTAVNEQGAEGVFIQILIGPDDGANNFIMRRFRVVAGGHTPLHTHAWEHEVYILAGRGEIVTPEGPRALKPGDAVFAPGGMQHQFRNTGQDDFEFLCLIPNP